LARAKWMTENGFCHVLRGVARDVAVTESKSK
jgi:hypothetical protein